jgi:hypothetical protein
MSVCCRINGASLKHLKNIQEFMFYNIRGDSLGRSSVFQRGDV